MILSHCRTKKETTKGDAVPGFTCVLFIPSRIGNSKKERAIHLILAYTDIALCDDDGSREQRR